MKIGIDARMYGPAFTGIGRYTAELIDHLAPLDDRHEYVVFLRKEQYGQFMPPSPRFRKVLADYPHYSLGEQWGFLRQLLREKLDLVHFAHFNAPLLYFKPFVVTIHDLTLSFFPGKKMNRLIHRLAYHLAIRTVTRRAKRILAVSKNTQKDLAEVLGLPLSKIEVAYNGIHPKFGQAKASSGQDLAERLKLEKPFFLYTGVWRDHKNLVGLIRAFASFNASSGGAYNLVITGKPNPFYSEVPQTIAELGLERQVRLVGMVSEEDLFGLYRNALAYAFPSFYEGFGLPPLEAMQCGTPVIASNASSIPEICGEGNALFFDPHSQEEMVQAMRRIASDPLLRQQLIQRGQERVKHFDWGQMAKQTLEVYCQAGRTKE